MFINSKSCCSGDGAALTWVDNVANKENREFYMKQSKYKVSYLTAAECKQIYFDEAIVATLIKCHIASGEE